MKRHVLLLFLGTAMAYPVAAQEADNSDWWSELRQIERPVQYQPQRRHTDLQDLAIAGVQLGEKMYEDAAQHFGPAKHINRGDAGTARDQACYTSADDSRIYLIFESGEVGQEAYLFRGGAPWHGMEQCTKSAEINAKLRTAAGLHLGMTRVEVEKILGPPTKRTPLVDYYWFQEELSLPEKQLAVARTEHPGMSDHEIFEKVGHVDRDAGFEVRYDKDRATFLEVSLAETE